MYQTSIKITAIVLLAAGLGGAGAVWLGNQRSEAKKADDRQTIVRNKALSRINLRKLALAMHRYEKANKHFFPPPALVNKEGKALLSWRVLLLPYLGERALYEQFKLAESWDSPHNKKLLSKMPNVYAPPGVKTRQPFSTFYQVFVSPNMQGQQMRFPVSFTDGAENTLLIVEAGKALPWTKPEDLPFGNDKPLPELGGLFADVFHALYANGDVHTLTKKFDENILRAAITSSGGEVMDLDTLDARSAVADWRRKNRGLQQILEFQRERLRLLREERDALRGRSDDKRSPDADSSEELKKENARLQNELDKAKKEIRTLHDEILQKKSP